MTPLTADAIARRLTTVRYGRSLDVRAETGSTNDDAREAAGAGAADGHVVVADRQSRGRGARGRVWASPGGTDLYFSIVARLPLTPAQLPPLTLAVGLGVARAAEATLPDRSVSVKWPNDVLIEGKKHAGILVESVSLGSRIDSAIIGVGVDVNRADFGELGPIATSWRAETGQTFDRAQALATLLSSIEAEVDRFVRLGPRPVASAVEDRLAFRGRRVRCDALEGELLGLREDGALRLRTSGGERAVTSGSLRLV
ncbi:MAG: biotin--[acetyl-CoA-carboxylase] ligase [Sandaracinaceae bacterium]